MGKNVSSLKMKWKWWLHAITLSASPSDNKEIWDELTSEVNRVVKCSDKMTAEAIRRAQEGCIEMQASIANLHQHINALRKSHRKQGAETSHLQDGQSQTRHTRNDKLGLPPQRDSCPIREGHKQDGPTCHPSNQPMTGPKGCLPK